jgi:hypothetical protein
VCVNRPGPCSERLSLGEKCRTPAGADSCVIAAGMARCRLSEPVWASLCLDVGGREEHAFVNVPDGI